MSFKFGAAAFFDTEGAAGMTASYSAICSSLGITASARVQILEDEDESLESLRLLGGDLGDDPVPLDLMFR